MSGMGTGGRRECGKCWSHEACGRYGCQAEAQELHEMQVRAGIQHTYAVRAPELARNGSWNHPTLYTFQAASDEDAISQFQAERAKMNKWDSNTSRMKSGGVNYSKVAQLYRSRDDQRIDPHEYDPKKPVELRARIS